MASEAVLQKLINGAAERASEIIRNLETSPYSMIMIDSNHEVRAITVQSDLIEEIRSQCRTDSEVTDCLLSSYAAVLRLHKARSYAIATPAYFDDPDTGQADLVIIIGAYSQGGRISGYFPVSLEGQVPHVSPFVRDDELHETGLFDDLLSPVTVH